MEPKGFSQANALVKRDRCWAAWTRYPLGRWRRTFLGVNPEDCRAAVQNSYGNSVETVILPEQEEPIVAEPRIRPLPR